MFCKRCGKELLEGAKFCPECGETVVVEEPTVEVCDCGEPVENKPHVPKCFTVFGKIGYPLSIVTFVCSFIPFLCMISVEIGVIALVFSILSKRDPQMEAKSKKGKIFSILGLIFGFIMCIVTGVIMGLLGMDYSYDIYF